MKKFGFTLDLKNEEVPIFTKKTTIYSDDDVTLSERSEKVVEQVAWVF